MVKRARQAVVVYSIVGFRLGQIRGNDCFAVKLLNFIKALVIAEKSKIGIANIGYKINRYYNGVVLSNILLYAVLI